MFNFDYLQNFSWCCCCWDTHQPAKQLAWNIIKMVIWNVYCKTYILEFSNFCKCLLYTFSSYPNLLMVDATFRWNNLQLLLYLFVVEDGNLKSELIGLFLVVSEGKLLYIYLQNHQIFKFTASKKTSKP